MKQTDLDSLGELITKNARDSTLKYFDRALKGQGKDIYSLQIKKILDEKPNIEQKDIEIFIIHAVDSAISTFLQMIDSNTETLQLLFTDEEGKASNALDLTDSLEAEYSFAGGWSRKYSQFPPDVIQDTAEGRE